MKSDVVAGACLQEHDMGEVFEKWVKIRIRLAIILLDLII